MYIDPRKINLQNAAGMQLVELIRELGDAIGSLPYDETPTMAGTGSAGECIEYARGDHQHPSDTSKLDVSDGERIENEALGAYPVNSASGDAVNIKDSAGLNANKVVISIEPVQAGSGDPAPDNVRTISGWVGANLYKTGKNIVNISDYETQSSTNIRDSVNAILDTVKYAANTRYIIGFTVNTEDTEHYFGVQCGYSDGTSEYLWIHNRTNNYDYVITSANKSIIWLGLAYDSVFNLSISDFWMMAYPDGDEYEEYDGEIITVSFGSEVGTVYGGTLDITNGTLTITHVLITKNTGDMNNDELYPGWKDAGVRELVGENLNTIYREQIMNIGTVFGVNTTYSFDTLILPTATYEKNQTQWIEAAQDVQIAVPLTVPIVYQLTPVDIETIAGTNNIWCNCGETSVTYKANVNNYIDNKINAISSMLEKIITANIESEMKATTNYTAGDLIIANGKLYKASSNIASDATLTVGTNVTATTIAAELASISVGG